MRIAVTHAYSSRNKGDAAILLCQLNELRRVFPDAVFEISALAHSTSERTYDGTVAERSLMSTVIRDGTPRPLRPVLGCAMMGATALWALAKTRLGVTLPLPKAWSVRLHALSRCDAQVCVGGSYLRGRDDVVSTYNLALLVHQIVLGHLLKKPVYLYAQSFGPFPAFGQRWLFQLACFCSSLALARESISHQVAMRVMQDPKRVVPVIDTAFLVESSQIADLRSYFGGDVPPVVVGITARQWLSPAGQASYEMALAGTISEILARGWGVIVIPQVTATLDDDREVGRRLQKQVGGNRRFVAIDDELTVQSAISLYGSLDYLIGTRFHSVIFSLSQGVPCLAIEYEHKTSGILRDMGLGEWCIPIEDVTAEKLCKLFLSLVAQRETVLAQVAEAIPAARAKARTAADRIAKHLLEEAKRS